MSAALHVEPKHETAPHGGEMDKKNPVSKKRNAESLAAEARKHAMDIEYGFRKEYYPATQFQPMRVYRRGAPVNGTQRTALPAQLRTWDDLEDSHSMMRQYVASHPAPPGVHYQVPITSSIVDKMRDRKAGDDAAFRDQFIMTIGDAVDPGMQKWIREVAPDFIERRVEMLKRDLEIDFADQYISHFGITNAKDLDYTIARVKGIIKSSAEQRKAGTMRNLGANLFYVPGDYSLVTGADRRLRFPQNGPQYYDYAQNEVGDIPVDGAPAGLAVQTLEERQAAMVQGGAANYGPNALLRIGGHLAERLV